MNRKIRHVFIFIFVFSVFSLTLQASVISLCKNSKVLKTQTQTNPVAEEEEESHDSDESGAEVIYLTHHMRLTNYNVCSKIIWHYTDCFYFSCTKTIPIPPPEH